MITATPYNQRRTRRRMALVFVYAVVGPLAAGLLITTLVRYYQLLV